MTSSSGISIPNHPDQMTTTGRPPTSGNDSTADVAKQQAGEVAAGATDAGKHVASVAGDQAQQVAGEAKNQAQDLLHQTRDELTTQAAEQQKRVAGGLRALSDEFGSMARNSENPGMATDLTRQAGQHAQTVASWLEDREPGQIIDEVTRFARRKPGTFLALAAGAGLLAGRLGRGLTAANTADDSTNSGSSPQVTRFEDAPTGPIPPLDVPATGYGTPPTGYAPGQHVAAPPQSAGMPESPYVVPPASAPQPGYAQPGNQQPGYQQPGYPQPGVNP